MTNDFKAKRNEHAKRPRLSPEEYAAYKKEERESVFKMVDEAAAEIVNDPEKFRRYLDTQSRMDRYSAANALLIYRQNPDARQLKSFDDWAEEGVRINKGAKHICILEPSEYTKQDGTTGISYNVKKVFDVAQTSANRPAVQAVNIDTREAVAVMLDMAPINKELADELPLPEMGAFYDNEKKTLYVKRNIGDSVALCQCVAQELGHAYLSMESNAYSRREMEFPAVCIGYMLCKKLGVDTKNFAIDRIPPELAGKEPKEIRATLSQMREAMIDIHSCVSEEKQRQKQERSKDYER